MAAKEIDLGLVRGAAGPQGPVGPAATAPNFKIREDGHLVYTLEV